MAVFKCKMCGGALEVNANATVAECEYCGTTQTLPKLDDDRKANLFDRANHFRRNNEFDKASAIYEQILNEDSTDAETYWSLVLCRYGIEYVEDPSSHKRVPTVNRAQFTSIFDDDNYKSALQYADVSQKTLYEEEAKAINEIQKGILAISQQEEPFDVFICYKESDSNGRRTPDSVLANDLYHQLTQEGFKVFFARITLEDKLGSAYEPYIFAALNSSKVMVALGTKPEYFNAVWVKNEWSRYLALIKTGAKKMLIPAYKDMDPYDLPEEFSHLQAQDMSKLGFMQDLIRGIKKILAEDAPKTTVVKETVVTAAADVNIAPLLKRAFMFLEDGEWNRADEFCEQVLNIEPECAEAYLGKLMAELRVKTQDNLKHCENPFDSRNNYQKVMRFGDDGLKNALEGYIEHIKVRNENARLEGIYQEAISTMTNGRLECEFLSAAEMFEAIQEYKDAEAKAKECREKAEVTRKNDVLADGKAEMSKTKGDRIENLKKAIGYFETISGWKDADEQIRICKEKIEELKAKAEADRLERERKAEEARKQAEEQRKKNIKLAKIISPIAVAVIAFLIVLNSVIIPNGKYNDALALMEAGRYEEAISAFEAMDGYKDSVEKINDCNTAILDRQYNDAVVLMEAGNYEEAIVAFEAMEGYKDSVAKIEECKKEILMSAEAGGYVFFGTYEQDNNEENGKEKIEWLVLEVKDGKALVISKYGLDCLPYNKRYEEATWETCTLRTWLNNDFINVAFSADEKAMIPTVTVSADKNPDYSTDPGKTTKDQVFLLSITEVKEYFASCSERVCEYTDYAEDRKEIRVGGGNSWMLRSPGEYQTSAAHVIGNGDVDESGFSVNHGDKAVRPALWIDLNA